MKSKDWLKGQALQSKRGMKDKIVPGKPRPAPNAPMREAQPRGVPSTVPVGTGGKGR